MITETLRMANIINAVWRKAQKDVEIKGQQDNLIVSMHLLLFIPNKLIKQYTIPKTSIQCYNTT